MEAKKIKDGIEMYIDYSLHHIFTNVWHIAHAVCMSVYVQYWDCWYRPAAVPPSTAMIDATPSIKQSYICHVTAHIFPALPPSPASF